jgi:O-antigen ligase
MGNAITRASDANRAQAIVLLVGLVVLVIGTTFSASSGFGGPILLLFAGLLGGYAVIRYPFLGVVIYVMTFLFTYPEPLRGSGNFTINNLLGMVLLPMLLFGTLKDGLGWFLRLRPLVAIIGAFAVLLTSGVIYNRDIGGLEGQAVAQQLKDTHKEMFGARRPSGDVLIRTRDPKIKILTRYVFLLFFVFFVRTPGQIKVIIGLLLSVLLMSYLNLSSEAGELGWGRGRLRVVGESGTALYTGTNPNKLAFYILMCITFLWYLRTRINALFPWLLWLTTFTGSVIALLMTGSRSGFLGLLVFLTVTLLEGRFSYRKLLGLALAAVLTTVQLGYNVNFLELVLPGETAGRLSRIGGVELLGEGQTVEGSTQKRARKIIESGELVQYAPLLGVGLGNFQIVQEMHDPTSVLGPPHNSYIWALIEGGMVTLGLYMFAFLWTLRALFAILRDYEGRFGPVDMRWAVSSARTVLILFLFFSFFADVWVHIYFYLIVGLCLSLIQLHRTYAETGHVPGTTIGPPGSTSA